MFNVDVLDNRSLVRVGDIVRDVVCCLVHAILSALTSIKNMFLNASPTLPQGANYFIGDS